ncbi:MAG: hypothetical protein ACO3JL_13895 [Myxococcota bacterium]
MSHVGQLGRVVSASFFLIAAFACVRERSPEQQIADVLVEGTRALEAQNIADAAALLADDYRDGRGRDKRAMKQLAFYLLRQGPLSLVLTGTEISVDPHRTFATVTTRVSALQTDGAPEQFGDLLPRGRSVDVELRFGREGDTWRVLSIDGDGLRSVDAP